MPKALAAGLRRVSIDRVNFTKAYVTGYPNSPALFDGVSVAVYDGSVRYHDNYTGAGYERRTAAFWWPPAFKVATKAIPVRVHVKCR